MMKSTSAMLFFGGSFNPVHRGHLDCAKAVAGEKGFDRVVLIPSAQPPHKPGDLALVPASDRLAMCRLAAGEDSLFSVDDREIRRAGPSYTIETVRELHADGHAPVSWLIGADMLRLLPKWHEPAALLKEVNFVIVARPGWVFDWETMPHAFRHLESHVVTAPLVDISATDIRSRAKAKLPIDHLVPKSVARYIEERKLYQA